MAQVYKIMNTVTGAFYLGCTADRRLSQRMKTHRYNLRRGQHGNKPLQAAWDKHGEAAFEIVLVEAVAPGAAAEAAEERHLALHVGKPYCYNLSRMAKRTAVDRVWTDAARAVVAARVTGAGNPFFGKQHTPEVRAKLLETNTGKPAHNRGVPMSDEQRAKLRAGALGRVMPPDVRAKISASMRAYRAAEGV